MITGGKLKPVGQLHLTYTVLNACPQNQAHPPCRCPVFNIDILDDEGNKLGSNEQGFIAIKLPLPPSCLTSIWGDTERFKESYLEQFPGYFATGDGGYFDDDGYLYIMGRVDDVINVAGHRLSTGEMEENCW